MVEKPGEIGTEDKTKNNDTEVIKNGEQKSGFKTDEHRCVPTDAINCQRNSYRTQLLLLVFFYITHDRLQ